jgi:type IV pilus assembly protein PilE
VHTPKQQKKLPLGGKPMLRKLMNQKGFTLVEILVVVIIVAILAAIAVPLYMRYVEKARSSEAQTALSTIRKTYEIYFQQNATLEGFTIEDALKSSRLGAGTIKNWKFEVVGNQFGNMKYIATSTQDFPGGEGRQVMYDSSESKFRGYGIDDWTNPDNGGVETD